MEVWHRLKKIFGLPVLKLNSKFPLNVCSTLLCKLKCSKADELLTTETFVAL